MWRQFNFRPPSFCNREKVNGLALTQTPHLTKLMADR
jgi:hypothetical protein